MKHRVYLRYLSLLLALLWAIVPLSAAEGLEAFVAEGLDAFAQTAGESNVQSGALEAAVEEYEALLGENGEIANVRSYKLTKSATVEMIVDTKLQVKLAKGVTAKKWTSSKKSVATVSDKGLVTALKKGTTKIKVTTNEGKKLVLTVKVSNPVPKKIKIVDGKKLELEAGESHQLYVDIIPSNAETKLTWKSSNTKVATVSKKGVVKAVKPGKATVTVTTSNGKKAKIAITVYREQEPTPKPTEVPTPEPTAVPTPVPTAVPTPEPTAVPTPEPTAVPTPEPTREPEKITELALLLFNDIPTANSMLEHKLHYYKEDMYVSDGQYFSVNVDSSGIIHTVGFFNDYGDYTLCGLWPGRSLSAAVGRLVDDGWELERDEDQIGIFSNSELPGCMLAFAYANGKVSYIMVTY